MIRTCAPAVMILSVCILSACRTSNHDASETKLVGGREARPGAFPFAMIWTTSGSELTESYCTGSKIAPDLILTAAHCVLAQEALPGETYIGSWKEVPELRPGMRITYSFDTDLADDTARQQRLQVAELYLHPLTENCVRNPESDPGNCQFRTPIPDVAVLRVRPATNSPFAAAPAARLSFAKVQPGQAITMMGYGSEGDTSTRKPRLKFGRKQVAGAGELRAALGGSEARLDGFPASDVYFGVVSDPDQPGHVNLGSGDSGGPVLLDGTDIIAGVNADGYCPRDNRDCQRTNNSVFARLSNSERYDTAAWLQRVTGLAGTEETH